MVTAHQEFALQKVCSLPQRDEHSIQARSKILNISRVDLKVEAQRD